MGCDHAAASVVRTRDQAHAVAEEVLRKAKAGDDFARLALDYSDEPNASARGGSLGRFGHGQMVKAFEEAAFALAPGEISGIVETPFGYHVIQRTE
jgi:NIMA-interacting peptidyl-prolyl cis-trans isomerase 1